MNFRTSLFPPSSLTQDPSSDRLLQKLAPNYPFPVLSLLLALLGVFGLSLPAVRAETIALPASADTFIG